MTRVSSRKWIDRWLNHVSAWVQLLLGWDRAWLSSGLVHIISFSFWKISWCRSGSRSLGIFQTLTVDVMMVRFKDTKCYWNHIGAVSRNRGQQFPLASSPRPSGERLAFACVENVPTSFQSSRGSKLTDWNIWPCISCQSLPDLWIMDGVQHRSGLPRAGLLSAASLSGGRSGSKLRLHLAVNFGWPEIFSP